VFSISEVVGLFFLATVLALLEVQVEGKFGWAEKLPCWRPKNPEAFAPRTYSRIMGDRPLTGYHIVFFSLAFLILHYPFLKESYWSVTEEMVVISEYCLVMTAEDFLWFVWNPAYGLIKFKPGYIPWHRKWIGFMPTDYLVLLFFSFLFASFAGVAGGGVEMLGRWAIALASFAGLSAASCLIARYIRKGQASA
jgi:hypothetical protein